MITNHYFHGKSKILKAIEKLVEVKLSFTVTNHGSEYIKGKQTRFCQIHIMVCTEEESEAWRKIENDIYKLDG